MMDCESGIMAFGSSSPKAERSTAAAATEAGHQSQPIRRRSRGVWTQA